VITLIFITGCNLKVGNYEIKIDDINSEEDLTTKPPKVSISELKLNPDKYDGEKIIIRGRARFSGFVNSVLLEDDDGIYIWVKTFWEDRNFDYGNELTGEKGAYYTAKGVFHKGKDKSYQYGDIYLEATEPIKK